MPSPPAVAPRVAVVIAARDAASTIEAAIASALAQDVALDVIVVDDASNDDTAGRARAYGDRVRVLTGDGRGPGVARNLGVENSNAPLLLFLDADDELAAGSVAARLRFLDAHPDIDAACGRTAVIDGSTGEVRTLRDPGDSPRSLIGRILIGDAALCVHSVLIRRAWFAQVGGFSPDHDVAEDLDLWLRLAQAGCRFAAVATPPDRYIRRPGSRSQDALGLCRATHRLLRRAWRGPLSRGDRDLVLGRLRHFAVLEGAHQAARGESSAARRAFVGSLRWARRPGHVIEALSCAARPRASRRFLADADERRRV